MPRVFQTPVWCVAGPWISREPAWPRRAAPTDLPTEKETWLRRSTHVFSNQPATADLTLDDISSQQPSHPVSSKSTTTKVRAVICIFFFLLQNGLKPQFGLFHSAAEITVLYKAT